MARRDLWIGRQCRHAAVDWPGKQAGLVAARPALQNLPAQTTPRPAVGLHWKRKPVSAAATFSAGALGPRISK